MYDLNTKNISFLQMSKALKDHGVNNNKFMLWLDDPSISGVDPYNKDLSFDEKARIFTEVCKNYWYFLREVCMVTSQGSSQPVHFKLSLGSLAMSYCNLANVNTITMLPRQQGKTVAEVCFSVWVHLFATYSTTETYLHKAQDGSIDNLKRFKEAKEALPLWMQEIVTSRNDKDNLEEKYFAARKNQIRALASAATDEAADKMGRGSSTPLVYMDEFAFMARNKIIYNALLPAWATAAGNAKKNHAPYGIRITTTPNKLSLDQARYCYETIQNACKFSFQIYDIPLEQLSDYIGRNSGNDFVYITYSYTELGLTKEWYNQMLRLMNNDTLNAKRELDLIWPESDEDSVFSEDELDNIRQYLKPILFTLTVNGYAINFYEHPDFTMNYILSCDVSGGLSQDRSVISIIDPRNFHIVGIFASARIDTDSFRQLIYAVMTQYLIHSILVMENNSYGLAILDVLMKNPTIEPRMYREVLDRKAEKTLNNGMIQEKKTKKVVYGVATTSASRKIMYDILGTIVREEPEVIVADMFYSEIKTLQVKKTGKIEAMDGMHDDIIMSYLVFRYALACGKCLKQMFGISPIASQSNGRSGEYDGQVIRDFGNIIDMANMAAETDNPTDDSMNPIARQALEIFKPDPLAQPDQTDDDQSKNTKIPIDQRNQNDDLFMKICNLNSDPDQNGQNNNSGWPF